METIALDLHLLSVLSGLFVAYQFSTDNHEDTAHTWLRV